MQDQPLQGVYFFLMERIQRRSKEMTKARMQALKIDLTVDQWILIKRIAEEEGISQKELADTTFKEPAAVTRMLDLLIKKKLIEKKGSVEDRRKYELYLTALGQANYLKALPIAIDIRAQGLEGVSKTELETLKKVLNQIYQNLG